MGPASAADYVVAFQANTETFGPGAPTGLP